MKSGREAIQARAVSTSSIPLALHNFQSLPDDAQVAVDTVAGLFDCGISTVWARVKRCELPKPRKFGRSTRWRVGDLRAMLAGEPQ